MTSDFRLKSLRLLLRAAKTIDVLYQFYLTHLLESKSLVV